MHYDRNAPFLASLKNIYPLSKEGSSKETYHLALDIKDSKISFQPGDSIAVLPSHDNELVEQTLQALKLSGKEIVKDPRTQEAQTLFNYLKGRANITKIHKSLLEALLLKVKDQAKLFHLQELINPSNHEQFLSYASSYELWDCLLEYPEVCFEAQEIVDLLPHLLPRFYSIASCLEACPDEVHLTVAMSDFETRGIKRFGVGTHFLCRLLQKEGLKAPIYVHPAHGFSLPEDHSSSIIMIGPGTGIAPFRAFMQKRMHSSSTGKNWLFFGERHQKYDFFYEDFWKELVLQGKLDLTTAFSRDSAYKIYVQHKMLEEKEKLWSWLQEGAYLYVCGDLHYMAKDVELSLHAIIKECGALDDSAAREYIKRLRKEKRYQRDVY